MTFTLIQELMLLEKISVTSKATQLRQRIKKEFAEDVMKWYKQNLKKFPFYVYKDDPDATGVYPDDGIQMCFKFCHDWFTKFFKQETCVEMDNWNFHFVFRDLGAKVEGSYNNDKGLISIHEKYMNDFCKSLYNSFSNFWFDTGFEEQRKIDMNDYDLSQIINRICEIWAHEVVHAHQGYRSKIHDAYRSYVQKDKKKFWELIRNGVHEVEYLASPEEIGAFAQEFVYDLLKDIEDEDTDYQMIIVSDTIKYISARGTRYDSLVDNKDPVVQKVVKRFLKKVYEELDARRDEIIAKKKAELKKAKEQEKYDEWMKELDKELGLA